MSATRSRADARTADLAVRNLDVTRAHRITVEVRDPETSRIAHTNTYPLPSGDQAVVDVPLSADTCDVEVTVDGCVTTVDTVELDEAGTAVVAVGNGLVHVGDGL